MTWGSRSGVYCGGITILIGRTLLVAPHRELDVEGNDFIAVALEFSFYFVFRKMIRIILQLAPHAVHF